MARSRFWMLVLGLSAFLALGEVGARVAGEPMLAVAHRVNFKLELLRARGRAEVVVLGSSRGNDCVEPRPWGVAGASVATPSSSLPTLESIAERVASTPGLKLAVVELSRRQMADGFADVEAPVGDVDPQVDPLGSWLAKHSALLRGRRAFALDNWPRLPALLFPSRFDGSEFFHTRWLSEALVRVPAPAAGELTGVGASSAEPTEASGDEWERVSAGYRRTVEAFERRGVRVVLYGPPLAPSRQAQECDEVSRGFRAAVARRAQAPFLDFACSAVPANWLVDGDEHCGALGRARFSQVLAEAVRGL